MRILTLILISLGLCISAGTVDLFFDFDFLALSAACVPAEIHSPKLIKIKVKIRMA